MNFTEKMAIAFLSLCAIFLNGCYTYKPISLEQNGDLILKVRLATKFNLPSKHARINVEVDSSSFRKYYLFFEDKLLRQDFKRKSSILYRLTFEQNPDIPLARLDTLVFRRVFHISDSLKINNILDFKKATGFVIDKTYK